MPKKGQYDPNASADSKRQRKYNSKASSKKDRASRNAARAAAVKAGKARKGDGKDVDHQNMNPRDNRASNLKVMDKSKNRAKNQHAKRKGSK